MVSSASTRSSKRAVRYLAVASIALALSVAPALAAPPPDIDKYVSDVLQRFGTPAMSVAIVEGDKIVHAKGYGVREIGKPDLADAHTIFPIGSETKAFTATALGILVDRGKLKWDDLVVQHMPDFRMFDPYATAHMTVRDLLTHRSGLGEGEGDLLIVPTTNRSRLDIVHALQYLPPKTGFREIFAYDNILYIVAGQLVEAVSGQRWEEFIRDNIFKPGGMTDISPGYDATERANHVSLHARTDASIRGVGNQRVLTTGLEPRVSAPAGAINASATDMGRWMSILIGGGTAPGGKKILSSKVLADIWTPLVVVPHEPVPAPIAETVPNIDTYGLGWFIRDYRGHKIITHSGAVLGAVAAVVIIPEKNVGISVAINSEDGIARWSVFYHLLDHYLGLEPLDWPTKFETARAQMIANGTEAMKKLPAQIRPNSNFSLPVQSYAGVYRDPWYGTMTVSVKDKGLWVTFDRTPGMEGPLEPVADDTFRSRWTDRTIEDTYVKFEFGPDKRIKSLKLWPVSPLADFSFDYRDLAFIPESTATH